MTSPESPSADEQRFSIEFGDMLCMGCRPRGRCRFGMVLHRGPEGSVEGVAHFGPEHEGAGGVAHGGSVMGALDEACGAVSLAAAALSVTAEMDVRFRRPVPLQRDLLVRAWPESRSERGHWVIRATLAMPDADRPLCEARARFVERDPARHYGRFHQWLAERDGGAPVS
ncbi:PaaI family thioesterase [Pseudonocardia sp. WMMC193]|uniref:PaaI family thioesterase n=1 Tax=Pseudonocardia sp. WMMC193 TaxID=2911965 RepID=UPI001F422C9F|nr:PaaI family thioesterase [Pseudonocardia sp. WMMC193]MCF7550747.1 PaaI family thioesterase [Pseudonocardia sp. WMMC193]